MAEEVSSIGVRLTLDATGFTTPLKEASGALNTFQKQAERAASGVAQTRAGGGTKKGSAESRAAQNLTGVNVSLEINGTALAKLRSEVTKGLGAIPVTITPQFATAGRYSIQNIMGSMLSSQYGMTQQQGRVAASRAIESSLGSMPKKEHGGPVQANRPIVVGEKRAEVFVPKTAGNIEPSIKDFYRKQAQTRQLEMELATLEATTQRRHDREVGRIRGGLVRRRPAPAPQQGWDTPPPPRPRGAYPYPDDYRPGRGPTEWEQRDWGRPPRAPSRYPDWEDYHRKGRARMAGGPVRPPMGPLQRRLAGLPPLEPPAPTPPPQPAWEPEWMRRARESKLPPKTYRRLGGVVEPPPIDWRTQPNWRTVPRVENVRVSTLVPIRGEDRESHPRYAHDHAYLDNLTEKIRTEGFDETKPVVVHYDPFHHAAFVADGNHRLAAARRLGMETIPTTVTLVQRPQKKFRGRHLPGSSSTFPDETGYVPGSLPPSWVGLRQKGGPVWKKLLGQGVITTRNMGERARKYYEQRMMGFNEHGLMGTVPEFLQPNEQGIIPNRSMDPRPGPGREAFDRLVQAAGNEGDTNWNQFEAEFDLDFGRKVGHNTSFASRANLHEKLGQLMPIEPLMSISGKLRKLFEASPDPDEATAMVESMGLTRTRFDRIHQADDLISMTRDTLGSIDRKKALKIIERDFASMGREGHVGSWGRIEAMLGSMPRRMAFPPETRGWFSGAMSSFDKKAGRWMWDMPGGAKDQDLLPGFRTYDSRRNPKTGKLETGSWAMDSFGDVTGGNYAGKSEGLSRLTAKDFNDPTEFTDAGYKTLHKMLEGRNNARGGMVKHAGVGARALRSLLAQGPGGGGTYPVDPAVPVPTSGHALGISAFLPGAQQYHVSPDDPRAFMRAFHAQEKAGAPYVGTWWDPDTNMIDVDPSTVVQDKVGANRVLYASGPVRKGGEKAAYDLDAGDTWYRKRSRAKVTRDAAGLLDIIAGRRKRMAGGPVHAMNGRITRLPNPYTFMGHRITADALRPHVQAYREISERASDRELSVFGGNMWYPGRRRSMLQDADARGWLDRSSFSALRRSAEAVLAVPAQASPGVPDAQAVRWSQSILDAITHIKQPLPGMEEAFARALQQDYGLPVGYGYGNFAKAISTGLGRSWPPSFGKSPKVEPFYHATRGREDALVGDTHHLAAGAFDPDGPAASLSWITRNKQRVGTRPSSERALMMEASRIVQGEYAHVWPTMRRWQAGIWGEHFPVTGQPIEAAYTNLVIPKSMRSSVPTGWKAGAGGLLTPRAEGGFVDKLMGNWSPWMGYQMAQEAMARRSQQDQPQHAQDGAFTRLGHGAYTEPGADWFHYLPDTQRSGTAWRSPASRIHHPSAYQLDEIDKIRHEPIEHGLVMPPNSGDLISRHVIGDAGHVRLGDVERRVGVHNHPYELGSTLGNGLAPMIETVRPSNADVGTLFSGRGYEGWTVTPNSTSIMRTPAWIDNRKLGASMSAISARMAPQAYLEQAVNALEFKGVLKASEAKDLRLGDRDPGDWETFLDILNSRYISSNNEIWDKVMASIGSTTGLEYLRLPNQMLRTTSRPKGMDPETWKRFPKMMQKKVFHMAGGGQAGGGLYVVGEIGKELFVPQTMAHLIPKKVMDQIPRAAGGMQVIGQKPNSLFAPPEDGVIIPNRLMDQIPHAQDGVRDAQGRFVAGNPYRFNSEQRAGTVPVNVMNWPANLGGGSGGGGTRVRQGGDPADFQAQHGGTPTEEGSAPSPRTRGALPQARADEFSQMEAQLSYAAQMQGGRTPRGMAAVIGAQYFGGRDKSLEQIAAQRRAIGGLKKAETGVYSSGTTEEEFGQYKNALDDLTLARKDERGQAQLTVDTLEEGNDSLKTWKEANKEYIKTIDAGSPGLLATARNFGGIMLGVQGYSMAMQGVSFAMSAAGPAIASVADQLMGWQAASSKLTTTMADGIRQAHGNVAAVLAQTAANAGLSKSAMDYVGEATISIATAKAGAKAMAETGDLFRGAMGAENAPQGLYGGYGGILNSGLFAQQMGGGTGFTESVAGMFSKGSGGGDIPGALNTATHFLSSSNFRNHVVDAAKDQGNPLGGWNDAVAGAEFSMRMMPGIGSIMNLVMPKQLGGGGDQASGPYIAPVLKGATESEFKGFEGYREDLNKAIDRGAEATGESAAAHYSYATSQNDVTRALQAARAAGDDYGIELALQGVVLRDNTNKVIDNGEAYKKTTSQAARGKTIADVGTWASGYARQIEGQRQARDISTERAINIDIPWEQTKSLWSSPLIKPGASFFPGAGAGNPSAAAAGLTGGAAGLAQGSLALTKTANAALQQIADDGLAAMRAEIETNAPGDLKAFDAGVSEAQTLSASIAKLTSQMARLNREASQASWANQIRIATRALGDANAMLGKAGGTRLGYLQREQWLVSRASQALNLALQQRQITTQLALANFQAPGETGEERYFKQKQAIAEAGVAQKQLGYSEREFRLAGKLWAETAQRAATDAQKALEVMQKARNAEGVTIAAQETVARQQQRLGITVGKIDALVAKARGNFNDVLSAAASGVSEFSGSVEDAIDAIYGSLPGYAQDRKGNWYKPNDDGRNDGGGATGAIGLTRGTTRAMIGEAGTEAVAILRNPRPFELARGGGGGGPVSVAVNISGVSVRNDGDIHEMAKKVANEVERMLARKGQMFGLRGPAV